MSLLHHHEDRPLSTSPHAGVVLRRAWLWKSSEAFAFTFCSCTRRNSSIFVQRYLTYFSFFPRISDISETSFPSWVAVPLAATATRRTSLTSSQGTAVVSPTRRSAFTMSVTRRPPSIFSPSSPILCATRSSRSPPRPSRPAVSVSTST